MPPISSILAVFAALIFVPTSYGYKWPQPVYDELEDVLIISHGVGTTGLISTIDPCSAPPFGQVNSGRQFAAEWLRTMFHDVANYDNGIGGLDASISFETGRDQNKGNTFNDTLVPFLFQQSIRISLSDVIAMGAVLAVKNCGGPSIPYRGGRIDATGPGPATVPQPFQTLETHTADFARLGFSQADMIGVIACGHTLGGVQAINNLDILPEDTITPTNTDGMALFDGSTEFDNHIATQWIDGTTKNPLAVGFNQTTNSDARIFSSDGNKTMKALAADSAFFASQCADLFERLLNTVPHGVTLTDVIVPTPVKPWGVKLSVHPTTGMLLFDSSIRFFDEAPNAFNLATMQVSVTWKDRTSASCQGCTAQATYSGPADSIWGSIIQFNFTSAVIDPAHGISSFVIGSTLQGPLSSATNGGEGFPVQDVVLWQKPNSCFTIFGGNPNPPLNITAAIRNNVGDIENTYVSYSRFIPVPGSVMSQVQAVRANLTRLGPSASPLYTLYSVLIPQTDHFDVVGSVGGKTYSVDYIPLADVPDCPFP